MNGSWRKDFPQLHEGYTYLDTAAMSLKPEAVINAVDDYYRRLSVNVHRGFYESSIEATRLYEESREKVAEFIGATPEEIVFTRGTTASLNLVASAYGNMVLGKQDEIITTELEHNSSFLPWQVIAKKTGARIRFVPLDDTGRITIDSFRSVLSNRTRIVAITYVSNVMGYKTPIEEIIRLAHGKGATVVLDAAQAIQHLRIDVRKLDVDFLAFSGHKMLAPTGIGCLFGKKALLDQMEPIEFGGDMNEDVDKDVSTWKESPGKFEAGTMPVAQAIGLKAAIEYLLRKGIGNIEKHTFRIYRKAYEALRMIEGITIYNHDADTGIIAFNIDNVPAHDAISFFAENGIAIRAGQHCAQLITRWLGIDSCLRASFYLYNDEQDVDRFIESATSAVDFFRKLGF